MGAEKSKVDLLPIAQLIQQLSDDLLCVTRVMGFA
jgi:hypothetical protein